MTLPAEVSRIAASVATLAVPKSTTLSAPAAPRCRFAGLTSRCTTPARCAASSPSAACPARWHVSDTLSGPRPASSAARSLPVSNSITRYGRPSCSPVSSTVTTLGWTTRAAVLASRANRSRVAASATAGARILTATAQPGRRS